MSLEMKLSEENAPSDFDGRTEAPEREGEKSGCCLLNLSDYAMLHVFSFLNATDLYQLSRTCKRMEDLVKEKKLWFRVDARDEPITKDKVNFCVANLNARTEELYFAANNRAEQVSTYSFLTSSSVSQSLRVLAIENQLIRGDLLTLAEYPVTLVELSFRKSFVVNFAHFFRRSDHAMKNLKVLVLDECGWVETNMMVSFSKYPKLEILSLYMCKKISDNDISYLSLAGCFGFKNLRVLDARFTGLGDQILKTFYKHKTLRELYFQSYVGTYTLEKSQRELELVIGSLPKKHHYLSPFDDIPDTQLEPMRMFFGKHTYKTYRMQTLSDEGVVMYKFVEPDLTQDYKLDSVLYEPPYGLCQCGFYDFDRTSEPRCSREVKTVKSEIARLEQIIALEKRIKFLSHMYMLKPKLHLDPRQAQVNADDYEAEASPENKSLRWLNLREPRNEYEIVMLEHTDLYALTPELSSNNIVINFLRLGNEGDVESEDESSDNEVIFANPALYNEQMEMRPNVESDEEMRPDEENPPDQNDEYILGPPDDGTVKADDASIPEDTLAESNAIKNTTSSGIVSCECDSFSNADATPDVCNNSHAIQDVCDNSDAIQDVCDNSDAIQDVCVNSDEIQDVCNNSDAIQDVCDNSDAIQDVCNNSDGECSGSDCGKEDLPRCNGQKSSEHRLASETSLASTKDSSDTTTTNTSKRKNESATLNGTSKKMKCLLDPEDDQPGPSGLSSRQSSTGSEGGGPYIEPGPSGDYAHANLDEADAQEVWNIQPDPNAVIRVLIGEGEMKTTAVRRLSLRGYGKVTDTSLYYLSKLKLELLDVTQTSVTKRGVCDFMLRNPDCRVIHESTCVCRPRLHF